MLPRGLLGLGTDTIDHSGAEIRQTLAFFASAQSLPVLIHCTQGKDRTGTLIQDLAYSEQTLMSIHVA